jgi:hypothetical protein
MGQDKMYCTVGFPEHYHTPSSKTATDESGLKRLQFMTETQHPWHHRVDKKSPPSFMYIKI